MASELFKLAESFDLIATSAKKLNRKQLQKQLEKTRSEYTTYQKSFNTLSTEYNELQKKLTETKTKLESSRSHLLNLTNQLQTMDLAGANALKQYENDVSYVIDGKDYFVDTSDVNDVKCMPWKDHKKSKKTNDAELSDKDLEALLDSSADLSE